MFSAVGVYNTELILESLYADWLFILYIFTMHNTSGRIYASLLLNLNMFHYIMILPPDRPTHVPKIVPTSKL